MSLDAFACKMKHRTYLYLWFVYILHLATDFLNNNNSDIAGWIFLFADKHS